MTSVTPELKVFYVDFGNEEVCTPDQLKAMPLSIVDIPALVSILIIMLMREISKVVYLEWICQTCLVV